MSKKLFILPIVSFFMQKGDNSMFFFFFFFKNKKKKARRLTLHKPKNKFPWKNTKVLLGKCSLYR